MSTFGQRLQQSRTLMDMMIRKQGGVVKKKDKQDKKSYVEVDGKMVLISANELKEKKDVQP